MKTINVKELASKLTAYKNCQKVNNLDWEFKHKDAIELMLYNLPSGSGLDNGVKFDWNNSNADKLVFTFSYHHLNENGYYEGWTDHKLIITPSLAFGIKMNITGKDKNQVKEYLYDTFNDLFTV